MPNTELHFAMTEATHAAALSVLFPAVPTMHEHGFIGLVRTSSGRRRRTILLHQVVTPGPGEVSWHPGSGLHFSPGYKSRALDLLSGERGGGLVFVHTHPGTPDSPWAPRPSLEDLEADEHDLFFLGQALPPGTTLAAAVVALNGKWSFREYEFRFPESAIEARRLGLEERLKALTYAGRVRIVGPGLRFVATDSGGHEPQGDDEVRDDAVEQDSSLRLWGPAGQRVLRTLRIGLTGLGGVGGILAEHLARLGVGELVLLDYDRLHLDNFNRSQGATRAEAKAGELKVIAAQRIARASATASDFAAHALRKSVVEADAVADLLDCDLILNGADSAWARQVLDQVAFAHLIPVINGGTTLLGGKSSHTLVAGKSEVTATGPGHPCMECSGSYTRREVSDCQEPPSRRGPRRYIDDGAPATEPERAPSVISNNALVAAVMQLRLQALVLRMAPDTMVGTQRFHVLDGVLEWALRRSCLPDCGLAQVIGCGDSHDLPVGVDLDFQVMRAREAEAARAQPAPLENQGAKSVPLWRCIWNRLAQAFSRPGEPSARRQ